jgi:hypothetical protein
VAAGDGLEAPVGHPAAEGADLLVGFQAEAEVLAAEVVAVLGRLIILFYAYFLSFDFRRDGFRGLHFWRRKKGY